jgi:hypothetical protein
MKVIRDEDAGMNLPAGLGASLAQGLDEALPIRLVLKDGFAPVVPIHEVII